MQIAAFTIEGMRCAGCAERVRTLLERRRGVREACVPFAAGGDATVRFDPHVTSREQLVAVIETAGFRVAERT